MIREVWQAAFGEDVTTKPKSGPDQHRVLCPFHHERNPSCDVSIRKDAFICRSCGKKGGYLDVVVLAGYADTRASAARWLENHGVRL